MQIQGEFRRSISCVCSIFLLAAAMAVAQDPAPEETFGKKASVPPLAGTHFASFDISFVDPFARVYLLADRTNQSLDQVDLNTGALTYLKPGTFRGAVVDPNVAGPNDVSGPNGVVTVHHSEAWVTDAPSFSSPIVMGPPATAYAGDNCDSPVYVIDLITGNLTDRIDVGGCFRADEVAWDPRDEIFLVANPGEQDIGKPGNPTAPFITLISTWPVVGGQHHPILKKIPFDGTNGTPDARGFGIEQAVWSPKTGLFYIALPGSVTNPGGGVVVVDPVGDTGSRVLGTFGLSNCNPNGAALRGFQLFLGCTAGGEQVIDIRYGAVLVTETGNGISGGCDEVTFNPADNHFAGACSGHVEIFDAKPPFGFDQRIAGISHSIASDPVTNLVIAPVGAITVGANACGAAPNPGCIVGFGVTSGTDDPGSWGPPRRGDNQGGDNQGGDNQGGDNQGGDGN